MTAFTCATCIFFDRFPPRHSDKPNKLGTCRCNPPTPVHTDDGLRGVWPTVLEYQWCGGHTEPVPEAEPIASEPEPVAAAPTVAAPARSPEPTPAEPVTILLPAAQVARLPKMVRRVCDVCTSWFNTDDPNKFCCDGCMKGRARRGAA